MALFTPFTDLKSTGPIYLQNYRVCKYDTVVLHNKHTSYVAFRTELRRGKKFGSSWSTFHKEVLWSCTPCWGVLPELWRKNLAQQECTGKWLETLTLSYYLVWAEKYSIVTDRWSGVGHWNCLCNCRLMIFYVYPFWF